MNIRILITGHLPEDVISPLKEKYQVEMNQEDRPLDRQAIISGVKDKHGLLPMLSDSINGEVLNCAPHLKMIANFGDNGKCVGYLLGKEREGMKIMFHLMNAARIHTGVQAEAVSSAAYMHAVTYARNRIQGAHITQMLNPAAPKVAIIEHPDVKRMLMYMKPTAFLINTSRGPVIDEKALVEVLRARKIGGAGLDVYENEPSLTPGLTELDNVSLLPHVGSGTLETRIKIGTLAVENLIAGLEDRTPPNLVNPEVLKMRKDTRYL